MRVGIVSLMHEANTFAGPTSLNDFERDRLLIGNAIREKLAETHHEIGGFFEILDRESVEVVPIFSAWTMPHGVIDRVSAQELVRRMMNAAEAVGELDGLLIAPHGAAVAEDHLDFDGYWMSLLRERFPSLPIVGTLDLHANLSEKMVEATDALVSYRENPHLDQRERGKEAATLLLRSLRKEITLTMAAAFPPLVANIEAQATSESPCTELISQAHEIRQREGVLSVSLNLGFPYADVPEMGVSVIVVTDGNPHLARQLADELAGYWWDQRERFRGKLISVQEAVERASHEAAPVGLLDMGDNVGGGSAADGTAIVHELLRRGVGPAFAVIQDPTAVLEAVRVGVGNSLNISVGGKTDTLHGDPIPGPFEVVRIESGVFEEMEARHGGIRRFDQGITALVQRDGLLLMLTSRRTAPFSLRQITAFGLDPSQFRVLVIKGVHAPVAAYRTVCQTMIRVNTPGITSADLASFTYRHRRRLLYPFNS